MKTIQDLKNCMPQRGKLIWIGVRSKRKADLDVVDQVAVSVNDGLEGDHYSKKGGKRLITLIQNEHIETVKSILNKDVSPLKTRRNLVVEKINLLALHEQRFRIGAEVILEGTGHCHPCSRMEENLGAGGYNAMRGHGGLTAKVIQSGVIRTGDEVVIISPDST